MDPGSVLEQYTTSLSNLPTELTFLLNELREKDLQFYDHRKKLQQYDSQIHKFIKQNGSLASNPKEAQLYPKIRALFDKCEQIQKEKCKLANTTLYFVSKYLTHLDNDVRILEKDGLLQLLDDNMDLLLDSDYNNYQDLDSDTLLNSVNENTIKSSNNNHKRSQSRKSNTHSVRPTLSINSSQKNSQKNSVTPGPLSQNVQVKVKTENDSVADISYLHHSPAVNKETNNSITNTPTKGDGEDQTLYCFCRQVSFGDMIACDNGKCRYEWFHYKCVGLTAEPVGKWYCSDCLKRMENNKKKKKKN